jgi:hypothetical protein
MINSGKGEEVKKEEKLKRTRISKICMEILLLEAI